MPNTIKNKYPDYVEVLTDNGFKEIWRIDFTDKVASINTKDNGLAIVKFTNPIGLGAYKVKNGIIHVEGKRICIHASIESRIPYIVNSTDTPTIPISNTTTTKCLSFPISGVINTDTVTTNELTIDDKLSILFDSVDITKTGHNNAILKVPKHVYKYALMLLEGNHLIFGIDISSDFVDIEINDYEDIDPNIQYDAGYLRNMIIEYGKYVDFPRPDNVAYCITDKQKIIDRIQLAAALCNSRTEIAAYGPSVPDMKMITIEFGKNAWNDECVEISRRSYIGFMYYMQLEGTLFIGRCSEKIFIGAC